MGIVDNYNNKLWYVQICVVCNNKNQVRNNVELESHKADRQSWNFSLLHYNNILIFFLIYIFKPNLKQWIDLSKKNGNKTVPI